MGGVRGCRVRCMPLQKCKASDHQGVHFRLNSVQRVGWNLAIALTAMRPHQTISIVQEEAHLKSRTMNICSGGMEPDVVDTQKGIRHSLW
jgi:hypothetical protein